MERTEPLSRWLSLSDKSPSLCLLFFCFLSFSRLNICNWWHSLVGVILIIRSRLFPPLIKGGWNIKELAAICDAHLYASSCFWKGHSLHHGSCCHTLSSITREPFGGPGSQRFGLSLETNMDWWVDSITALLQRRGRDGVERRTGELIRLNEGKRRVKGCKKSVRVWMGDS